MFETQPYEAETDGVVVRVQPAYLAGQSDPEGGRWVWAYQVSIENRRDHAVQLMARHWVITDARGHVEQVRGPGVIGEQPVIRPGDTYTYASGCPLSAPSGAMQGTYLMNDDLGDAFEVVIPAFSLDVPGERGRLN